MKTIMIEGWHKITARDNSIKLK